MHLDSVLRKIQQGEKIICSRCGKELIGWGSEWDAAHHYKTLVCTCGKKNWVKLDFIGSGHDAVLQERKAAIESAASIVRGGQVDWKRV